MKERGAAAGRHPGMTGMDLILEEEEEEEEEEEDEIQRKRTRARTSTRTRTRARTRTRFRRGEQREPRASKRKKAGGRSEASRPSADALRNRKCRTCPHGLTRGCGLWAGDIGTELSPQRVELEEPQYSGSKKEVVRRTNKPGDDVDNCHQKQKGAQQGLSEQGPCTVWWPPSHTNTGDCHLGVGGPNDHGHGSPSSDNRGAYH